MSFLTILYLLIIKPLELMFEVIFSISERLVSHPGYAIIILSLSVNFLVLPLYKRADAMQVEERDKENALAPGIEHLKKTFSGDERFMMLQTYYRQNDYSPTHVLKGSVSLFLQIPFFMAAYRLLSSLEVLQGVSFGPIRDLGAPDCMFTVFGFGVNVLPILMTMISIISAVIYTKGMPAKAKVQLFVMAAFFLVFLYNSPSGLAFYWLLNNVFSMVKNIFYKLKRPGYTLAVMSAIAGILIILSSLFKFQYLSRTVNLCILGTALILPLVVYKFKDKLPEIKLKGKEKGNTASFVLGGIFAAVLTGLLIPSSVLKASPEEFVDELLFHNPNTYLFYSAFIAAGAFVVWFGFFYILASSPAKRIMSLLIWVVDGVFIMDYMVFGKGLGQINNLLVFDDEVSYDAKIKLINLLCIAVLAAVMVFVFVKLKKIPGVVLLAGIIALAGMSVSNMRYVTEKYNGLTYLRESSDIASLRLSTEGKNVIVIMLDRGLGCVFPYFMNEDPDLARQFDGFTYYPNTISFGCHTKFGATSLEGGYEYTPYALNQRDTETLVDKTNEALKVMPVLFLNNGYDVTVCDPPMANYRWTPDLSIYDDYPEIRTFNTAGKFNDLDISFVEQTEVNRQRNFFCYSIFKVAPVMAQETLYNKGLYNRMERSTDQKSEEDVTLGQTRYDIYTSVGVDSAFLNSYTVLTHLNYITEINESSQDTFLFLENSTPHAPQFLQEPEYIPQEDVDNEAYEIMNQGRYTVDGRELNMAGNNEYMTYQVNMASYIQLGRWFDYLRANGVWDNTRIIIVADHGDSRQFFPDSNMTDDIGFNTCFVNPILLMKDFDSNDPWVTDEQFMTNADVPTMATSGVIDNPVNPFTGNPINNDAKFDEPMMVYYGHDWRNDDGDTLTYEYAPWFTIDPGPVFELDRWSFVGYE